MAILALVCVTTLHAHAGQKPKELLMEVNPQKAEKLRAYNADFLAQNLYFSSRHRIVRANLKVLEGKNEITITPFPDVDPIYVEPMHYVTNQERGRWVGKLKLDKPVKANNQELEFKVLVSLLSWDVDDEGNAHVSGDNRFEYSPYWSFDEFDNPILEVPDQAEAAIAGPPPSTPEAIKKHKKTKTLKKNQFRSAKVIISTLDGKKYVVEPLRFTPKYSVVYEYDPSKYIPIANDDGTAATELSPDDTRKIKEYNEFMDRHEQDYTQSIKGEVQ